MEGGGGKKKTFYILCREEGTTTISFLCPGFWSLDIESHVGIYRRFSSETHCWFLTYYFSCFSYLFFDILLFYPQMCCDGRLKTTTQIICSLTGWMFSNLCHKLDAVSLWIIIISWLYRPIFYLSIFSIKTYWCSSL